MVFDRLGYSRDSKTIKAAMKAAFIFDLTKLTFITQSC
jgi:hypothetical protein